jgi:putative tryptophan/tyrosine transport system substrate-binding protein
MRRREFIALLGGAASAASPLAAHAQQSAMPVIGYLHSASADTFVSLTADFRAGLEETGFVEGRTVTIEYRWAEGRYDRLPALAAELVGSRVDVIFATGSTAPALAAKAATTTIPIVFVAGGDPIRVGLVPSLSRPGGNVTGITFIASLLVPKRLEILYQLIPSATAIAALVNPNYPDVDLQMRELQDAGAAIKQGIQIVRAGTESDIGAAFATLARQHADALLVANDPFFASQRDQIVALAARHGIPVIYSGREFVAAGGLIGYGASLADAYRQGGIYTGRVLKGAKPADLPVLQPTKFEMVINLKTASTLGLTVPQSVLARADEVIE